MADDWNAQLDAKQLLLDERIAEQNRTVILDGVQHTVSATRRSSERAFVHELRTLGSSTGPLPSDCPAGCLVRDSDLTVNLADTATAAALFCKAGICVFNDVLPCGLIEECTPRPSRGGMIAFDYRLVHRGTSNERPRGGATRPILYIVYAVCGIDDEDNFPSDAPLFASDVSPV